jgi:hypothetical protein
MPSGVKSFVALARAPHAKRQVWTTIGRDDNFTIEQAREKAREAVKRIRAGQTAFVPSPSKPESFEVVSREYAIG